MVQAINASDQIARNAPMSTLNELIQQREALEAQIEAARKAAIADAVAQVKTLIGEYGLSKQDVFGETRRGPKPGSRGTVAPKYRDPATGLTWSGRGIAPKWLDGKDRSQFAL